MTEDKLKRIAAILKNPFAIYPSLTPNAQKVAKLAAEGKKQREIASELQVSIPLAASYLQEIKHKTGLSKVDLIGDLLRQIREVVDE